MEYPIEPLPAPYAGDEAWPAHRKVVAKINELVEAINEQQAALLDELSYP